MEQLKNKLRNRYLDACHECKKINYPPHAFLAMLLTKEDIVDLTRKLIHKEGGTSGFTTLYEMKRLDLSVEKIILEPQYRELFTKEDLRAAYDRLSQYEYDGLSEIDVPQ